MQHLQKYFGKENPLTLEDYTSIERIVRESMERLAESRLKGSEKFNEAVAQEIDYRRLLCYKIHNLIMEAHKKQED